MIHQHLCSHHSYFPWQPARLSRDAPRTKHHAPRTTHAPTAAWYVPHTHSSSIRDGLHHTSLSALPCTALLRCSKHFPACLHDRSLQHQHLSDCLASSLPAVRSLSPSLVPARAASSPVQLYAHLLRVVLSCIYPLPNIPIVLSVPDILFVSEPEVGHRIPLQSRLSHPQTRTLRVDGASTPRRLLLSSFLTR